jgi:hypothetical protein
VFFDSWVRLGDRDAWAFVQVRMYVCMYVCMYVTSGIRMHLYNCVCLYMCVFSYVGMCVCV